MLGKAGSDVQGGAALAKSSAPELNLKSFFAKKERKQAETAQKKSLSYRAEVSSDLPLQIGFIRSV